NPERRAHFADPRCDGGCGSGQSRRRDPASALTYDETTWKSGPSGPRKSFQTRAGLRPSAYSSWVEIIVTWGCPTSRRFCETWAFCPMSEWLESVLEINPQASTSRDRQPS